MLVSEKELRDSYEKYRTKYGGRREDYFALLYVSRTFGVEPEAIHNQIAFGGNDYGVDAYYIDTARGNFHLYQFKWSEKHQLFRGSMERFIKKTELRVSGIERIFGNAYQDPTDNKMLFHLKSNLIQNRNLIRTVVVQYVFNGDPEAAERSRYLSSLRDEIESRKYLVDEFIGHEVDLLFEFRSNRTGSIGALAHKRTTNRYRLHIKEHFSYNSQGGQKMLVCLARLEDFRAMFTDMGFSFFERNIRAGLSKEKTPNRALRQAFSDILSKKMAAEDFTFNHNGVTLFAQHVEPSDGEILLVEPKLLNGAQTITTLSRFLDDIARKSGTPIPSDAAESIFVLAKIIWSASDDFVTNVTICNNRQNPVFAWNLRAYDSVQLRLQDKIAESLGIYYERQEGAFRAHTERDLIAKGVDIGQGRAVEIKRLASTLLASQGRIRDMSHIVDVFETERLYRKTFKERYLRTDARKLLLAYKIRFRLSAVMRAIEERGFKKYRFVRRGRNLVWALLIQSLLNSSDLSQLLEEHGKRISVRWDFTDRLIYEGTSSVRLILGDAISTKEYKSKAKAEEYSFLRTNQFFEVCMSIARKRFGWSMKQL